VANTGGTFCVALGLLYHRASRSVLLQRKSDSAPWFPGMWELFGGRMEAADAGDPVATWRRELREELAITVPAERVRPVDDYVNEYGFRRVVFYTLWPRLQDDFRLTEGAGYGWLPVPGAWHLPELSPLARRDVGAFARTLRLPGAGPLDGPADTPYIAAGFLYHPPSGSVLLHHRGPDAPSDPDRWHLFGGHGEPADGGDPGATWRRELREELGVTLAAEQVVFLRPAHVAGRRRYIYYARWPTRAEDFVLGEGQGYAWYPLAAALAHPDLVERTRDDLRYFRDQLPPEAPLRSRLSGASGA
jgi:8-oxo-dGTP pyrophosphatase MutT (NUDIX family)